jgi:hypothetical protein
MAEKGVDNSIAAQIGICDLLMVFGINHLFADIKVPNEFSSGSPAKASEVNENFAALVEDIQAITEPEKKYSIISSETLASGLVRTTLYAYEESQYEGRVYFSDSPTETTGTYLVSEGTERLVNSLGEFKGSYKYFLNVSSSVSYGSSFSEFAPGSCPDGSNLPRSNSNIRYTHTWTNSEGTLTFANTGSANAGVYYGCDNYSPSGGGIEYYYLEGSGAGIYSCISRVAYYGAFLGDEQTGWSKAYAPTPGLIPYAVSGVFDRSSNGQWGSYYLEIDAPADCLNLD